MKISKKKQNGDSESFYVMRSIVTVIILILLRSVSISVTQIYKITLNLIHDIETVLMSLFRKCQLDTLPQFSYFIIAVECLKKCKYCPKFS